jgi:hypothetical protein
LDKSLSLDKTLLEKGLITPEQLTEAIQYQCRLPSSQSMSLAEVLVAMEYVTQAQIDEALGKELPPEDVLIQMLVKEGMIEEQQLANALKARQGENAHKRTGTMLLEMGYTTREMIESALTQYYLEQHTHEANFAAAHPSTPVEDKASTEVEHVPLGRKMVQKGLISEEELQDALDYQQRLPRILHKPIGEILVTLGYVDPEELEQVLNEAKKAPRQLSLGEVLVRSGTLQQWQLSHAMSVLETPAYKGKKLGLVLVELGYARRPDIESALKKFYNR